MLQFEIYASNLERENFNKLDLQPVHIDFLSEGGGRF